MKFMATIDVTLPSPVQWKVMGDGFLCAYRLKGWCPVLIQHGATVDGCVVGLAPFSMSAMDTSTTLKAASQG